MGDLRDFKVGNSSFGRAQFLDLDGPTHSEISRLQTAVYADLMQQNRRGDYGRSPRVMVVLNLVSPR